MHLRVLAALSVAVLGLTAFTSMRPEHPTGKCKKLNEACRLAGYTRGRSSGKLQRYYDSCLKPLTDSGTLDKLGVSRRDAEACARRWEERMKDSPYASREEGEE